MKLIPADKLTQEWLLRVALVVALAASCFYLLAPFVGALTWGVIIAVSLWPLFRRMTERLGGRKRLTSVILGAAMLVLVGLPLTMLGVAVTNGVQWVLALDLDFKHLKLPPPPEWVANLPIVGSYILEMWQRGASQLTDLARQAFPFAKDSLVWLLKKGGVAGVAALELIVAVVVASVLLAYHYRSADFAVRFATRLTGSDGRKLLDLAARTIRGVSLGVIGTALAQTVLTVLGFLVAGVPAVMPLGMLTFMVATVQLPTLFVWGPAALWLYFDGHTGWAIALGLWGLLVVNTIDNVLKPYLISQGARLPVLLIMLGVIGGIIAWGVVGLFIGPVLLAVAYTMLNEWLYHDTLPADPQA
ncbi:MAG: AI-2E family transporter [Rhodocyclaceae bacterium]|nr:AI-2E family transporter [Rhodocyclaceae bacterium]MBX3668990.1 AI-2E family transporter [Rhodocyclaceae bacterium]